MAMIMWAAPIGAFGAMAALVGATGIGSLKSLGLLMVAFYATCAIFVFVFLGTHPQGRHRASTSSRCFRYLGREFLLILSTSSSESALPRLIAKMEHLGVSRPVVGITVPTGYSFNLDGTAIYLTMASLFIAEAMDKPFSIGQQIGLLVFMIIASKGAAGVSGAGLATLAGGLQSHRPDLVPGVGFIVGIDRLMSEARALTNFAGNAIATVLIGTWVGEIDKDKATRVLAGQDRFDEASMLDDDDDIVADDRAPGARAPAVTSPSWSAPPADRTVERPRTEPVRGLSAFVVGHLTPRVGAARKPLAYNEIHDGRMPWAPSRRAARFALVHPPSTQWTFPRDICDT